MTTLAEVLAWKFNNVAGIRTRQKADGAMEIFDWPDSLGAMPAAADIAAWSAEYFAAVGKAQAMAEIDSQAEAARALWITPGSGQTLAYEAKRREAERWIDDSAPDPVTYPWAAGRAARLNGVTVGAVAVGQVQAVIDEWTAKVAAWEAAGIAIEDIREQAKEDIAAAADIAAVEAILAAIAWPSPA